MHFMGGGSGGGWVDRLRGVGYPVWGLRIEKKSPDFRSPEVGISGVAFLHSILRRRPRTI